jgi:hypothetical protein
MKIVRNALGAERAVAGSGLPWTTLRAAQFHDSCCRLADDDAGASRLRLGRCQSTGRAQQLGRGRRVADIPDGA